MNSRIRTLRPIGQSSFPALRYRGSSILIVLALGGVPVWGGCAGSEVTPGETGGAAGSSISTGGVTTTGQGGSGGAVAGTGGTGQAGASQSGSGGAGAEAGGVAGGSPTGTAGAAGSAAGAGSRGGAGGGGGQSGGGGTPRLDGGIDAAGGSIPDAGSGTGGGSAGRGGAGAGGTTGSAGTSGTGGAAGTGATSLPFSYWLAVDISFPETQPVATRANLLTVLKAHGINAVRLRTFVDPKAADGYDKSGGGCDLAHTIDFGKQIKAAGMGFLVDFHYSDNWADPGKQCVPIKWQGYTTITQLATAVHDYTKDAITQLIAGGARPDMVQIGNETTPGMLIHVCDSGGSPTGNNKITGSTSNWANLGALLKAGVDGVKEVDPKILTSFHIAKGGDHTDGKSALSTSVSWLTNALKYTSVDAFGESCYATYQGASGSASQSKMIWQTVASGLVAKFPNIKFFAAEYGGFEREINDVYYNLPNQAGLGTFFWEATMSSSSWNTGALVTQSGSNFTATSQFVPQYDQMKMDYASRL